MAHQQGKKLKVCANNQLSKHSGHSVMSTPQPHDSQVDHSVPKRFLPQPKPRSEEFSILARSRNTHRPCGYHTQGGADGNDSDAEFTSDEEVESILDHESSAEDVDMGDPRLAGLPPKTVRSPVTANPDGWVSDTSDEDTDMLHRSPTTGTVSANSQAHKPRFYERPSSTSKYFDRRPLQAKGAIFTSFGRKEGGTSSKHPLPIPSRQASAIVKPSIPRGKKVVERDGYSQTPTAVDHRKRNEREKDLQAQLQRLLDQDIVDQVEAEGGITPRGRLFKAGIRMMERVMVERKNGALYDGGGES